MKEFLAELHVHTVLSQCGDLLMTPGTILKTARQRGISLLAITDHNSAENLEVTLKLAPDYGIHLLPGMEVETKEEVHLVTIFDTLEQVLALQDFVYSHLPEIENDEKFFGPQILCNLNDEYVDRVSRLLAISTDLSVEEVVAKVETLGGLVYPAHVDRPRNSIISQLGFIPPELKFLTLEVTIRNLEKSLTNPLLKDYPLIPTMDVHYLDDLKGSLIFQIAEPTVAELRKGILGEDGRGFSYLVNSTS